MKLKTLTLFALMFFWLGSVSVALADDTSEPYHLLQGDAVMVSVWGDATLQKEVKVLPDGSITFPLAGRVEVAGLTTPEAEALITGKLKAYLPDPQVTVVVSSIEGNRVYVLGKVSKTGPIPLIGPITVMQALSMAGGLDKFADLDDIKVLRTTADGQQVIPVHYDKLLHGKDLETNIALQPGDTILVP